MNDALQRDEHATRAHRAAVTQLASSLRDLLHSQAVLMGRIADALADDASDASHEYAELCATILSIGQMSMGLEALMRHGLPTLAPPTPSEDAR